ncbi:MAG TPA: hypothetical protein VJ790_04105 [Dongiaceae bacterium]|nr:hypothetical protein [Dongiaceae bacterium]
MTVTIEEQPDRTGRRFAFRAARRAERRTFSRRSTDVNHGAFVPADQQSCPDATFDHRDPHHSSRFVAGAIAQTHPGAMLRDPRYREAAGAYRRSDLLGIDADIAGRRSDKKV